MIKLLLVEDDLDLAGNVMDYLELEDIVCDHASNGVAALQLLEENRYQVVVLDINLPRLMSSVLLRMTAIGVRNS